jgi:SgrR family transcriptional regulator
VCAKKEEIKMDEFQDKISPFMKLLAQYRRLHTLVQSLGHQPGLPALAQGMHCSERNMRNLLAKMQAQGWLTWTAGQGRGRHSELVWHTTPDALALDHMSELLREGDLEQAFAQLNPAQRSALSARLPEYLGADHASQRSLRMPVYRQVQSLDPLDAFSRLEAYLVRQIFGRLTEFDADSHRVVPGLAHHWESEHSAQVWHFWLRPGLSFHDGTPLTVHDVAATFERLRAECKTYQRLYSRIARVEVGDDQRVSFHLTEPHYLWPRCTANGNSSIVPMKRAASFSHMPVGSGPFRLVRNNAYQLTFRAFKDYYRERPLLDEIDLWVMEAQGPAPSFDLQFGYNSTGHDACASVGPQTNTHLSEPLAGCTYLICKPSSPLFHAVEQRLALGDWVATSAWLAADDLTHTPARGLLPQWKHRPEAPPSECPIPAGTHLRMVTGPRTSICRMAQDLQARFEAAGVRLEFASLPIHEWVNPAHFADADLVLAGEVMYHDQQFGCFDWFSADIMLRRWMPPAEVALLDAALHRAQTEPNEAKRMQLFEDMAKRIVNQGLALPLTHETQVLAVAPHVAGARIGPFGFAAFETLWRRG